MKDLINGAFNVLAVLFDKVPVLNKLKGYRSAVGFVGLAVVSVLQLKTIGSPEVLAALQVGFTGFTALALNAKGRVEQ